MSRASWLVLAALVLGAGCARDEAERLYRSALRGEETGMGRPRQIAVLTEAIARAPPRAWYYETRAIYQIDMLDYEAAHRDLDQAIALADRPYLRFLRGLVRSESTRFAAALDDFTLAIAREPGNAQFYRGRGLALAALGRFREALADADVSLTAAANTRLDAHNAGRCRHTERERPWRLDVIMEFADEVRAVRFERYLKSGSGMASARRHLR